MEHVARHETAVAACETVESRRRTEVLRARAHLLAGQDRVLLEMYLDHGNPFSQMARLAGVSTSSVARRVRRIIRRLMDETYAVCSGRQDYFSEHELALIKDRFVLGLSMACISRRRALSYHNVRVTIAKASGFVQSARALRRPTRGPDGVSFPTQTMEADNGNP
jgi:hypothetical protein